MSLEEPPLFDMEGTPPLRPQTQRGKLTWTLLKHSRFTCEECVANLNTPSADEIRAAHHLRQDYGDPKFKVQASVFCNIHAEIKKRADKAEGRWSG